MKYAVCALLCIAAACAHAKGGSVAVKGHFTKDGTYVAPHMRSAPDNSKFNNYSTQGNINPYTGEAGKVDPLKPPSAYTPVYKLYEPGAKH